MNFLTTLYVKALSSSTVFANNNNIDDIIGGDNASTVQDLAENALTVIQWAGFAICALLFAIAGIKWMISNQNGEETQKIKQGIKGLVIGAVILGCASVIALIVKSFVGFN